MAAILKHPDHSLKTFMRRTVAAQLHLVGSLLAIAGLVVLISHSLEVEDRIHVWACLVFSATSILVFAVSTIYHFVSDGYRVSKRLESRLEDLDHISIYLFIAGTYTPFILNVISPTWNARLLILIWSIAIAGISYTL